MEDHYTIATTPRSDDNDNDTGNEKGLHEFSSTAELLKARSEIRYDIIVSVTTIVCIGLLFGFFMNKSRVFDPFVIRDQFKWERMLMLKLFCSAGGTSCFSLTFCYFVWKEVTYVSTCKTKTKTNATRIKTNRKLHQKY